MRPGHQDGMAILNRGWLFIRQRGHPLALLLSLHIFLGLGFNLALPIFEGLDEQNHFLNIRYIQLYHALPVQGLDRLGPRAHHPPAYFALGALAAAWIPMNGTADRVAMQPNPKFDFRFDDPHIDNKAYFIHYGPEERWPYQGQTLAVHLIRLLSLAFSALAVWLTYLAAVQLRPGQRPFAFLAAGLLAFNPMVLYMSAVVQNNTAALASGAAVLCLLTYLWRQGFTPWRWMWVGLVWALGLLLQTGALALAAPIGILWLYDLWRTRRFRTSIVHALSLGLPVVALTGWWFVRNQILYGDWTGNAAIMQLWGAVPPGQRLALLPQGLYLVLTGLLGRFGPVALPQGLYWLGGLVFGLALLGGAVSGFSRLRHSAAAPFWAVHAVTVVAVAGSVLVYMMTIVNTMAGRYMFTAYESLALLLAAGCLAWFRLRWHGWVTLALVTLNAALAVYTLFGLVAPTYAPPRSPSAAELQQMVPLDANVGDAARVLGYKLSVESVRAGQEFAVTVYWQPLATTTIPYTVFVHLYEPSVGSLTQRDTYPGLGNWATTIWTPGRIFVDTYRLTLPPDAPAVDGAEILLGLYDQQTMQRLPVTGRDAGPPEDAWVEFGKVSVEP
jgi:hypothetical protein